MAPKNVKCDTNNDYNIKMHSASFNRKLLWHVKKFVNSLQKSSIKGFQS